MIYNTHPMIIRDSPEKKQIDEITFKHNIFYFQINMDNQDEIICKEVPKTLAIFTFFNHLHAYGDQQLVSRNSVHIIYN